MSLRSFLVFSVLVSIFGVLTVLLVAFNPPVVVYEPPWRKAVVGVVFLAVCVAGIYAAFSPETCSRSIGHKGAESEPTDNQNRFDSQVSIKGHHFDCGRFSDHIIHISDKTMCAACFGLALGALIAIGGSIAYFFLGVDMGPEIPEIVVVGAIAIALGLGECKFKGFIRVLLNLIFVVGGFLLVVGVDKLTKSLPIDIYTIGVITSLILTRVLLSMWDHWRTCKNCTQTCNKNKKRKVIAFAEVRRWRPQP